MTKQEFLINIIKIKSRKILRRDFSNALLSSSKPTNVIYIYHSSCDFYTLKKLSTALEPISVYFNNIIYFNHITHNYDFQSILYKYNTSEPF